MMACHPELSPKQVLIRFHIMLGAGLESDKSGQIVAGPLGLAPKQVQTLN